MLATSVAFELPTVLAWAIAVVGAVFTALLGIITWFLRREITKNDKTQASVQRLLEGNVEWIRSLSERVNKTDDKIDQVRRELTSESRSIDRRLAHVESGLWKGGNRGDRRDGAAEN